MNLARLLILFLMLAAKSSFATSSIKCSSILASPPSPEFANFTSPPRRPKIGNHINPKSLHRWVEAHREFGEDYVELASFLASHIKVLTHPQFESLLRGSMEKFFNSIPKDKSYYVIVAEEKTKSQFWVAHLVSALTSHRPPKDIILNPTKETLEAYIKENPDSVPLIVDDASYMGQNLVESISTIFSIDYSGNKRYLRINYQLNIPIEVHVVTAATAKEGTLYLSGIEGVHQYSSYYMPSARELLQTIPDSVRRNRLENTFIKQYDESALDLVLTGFAHKTADMASIVGMSSEETYEFARSRNLNESFNPKTTPYGSTILEGVLIGPDNLYRDTIPILNAEKKPYGDR